MSKPPCAACKYSRRKCSESCLLAPCFPLNKYDKFKAVHKVYGASHVVAILTDIHPSKRQEAVNSLVVEAETILRDPVGALSSHMTILQRKIQESQASIAIVKNEFAFISNNSFQTFQPPPPPYDVISKHRRRRIEP